MGSGNITNLKGTIELQYLQQLWPLWRNNPEILTLYLYDIGHLVVDLDWYLLRVSAAKSRLKHCGTDIHRECVSSETGARIV